jgi:hypothetical protein
MSRLVLVLARIQEYEKVLSVFPVIAPPRPSARMPFPPPKLVVNVDVPDAEVAVPALHVAEVGDAVAPVP